MPGIPHDVPGGPFLHDPSQIHDRDPVGEVGCGREVVRDHEHPHAVLPQAVEQAEDACTHRDIEHRDRLVGDQQLRLEHERGRDRHALTLATGELVGVAVDEELRAA